jgi:preprotein translocase SecE subunit
MAVATKNTPQTATRKPLDRLAVGSLAGALFVLGGLGIAFYGLNAVWTTAVTPWLATAINPLADAALFLVASVAALGALIVLGTRLVGPNPPAGLRAGIATTVAGILAIGLVTLGVGHLLARAVNVPPSIGQGITLGVGAALAIFGVRSLFRPNTQKFLVQLEEQGWFHAAAYKRSQGLRVRRATILGVLAIVGCGIYVLVTGSGFGSAESPHWAVTLPFTGRSVVLLRDVRFTMPIVLTAAALWFAWRLVNFPAFADFLIATEAEMNKVSWTTPRRLFQDTIVVLTTVILVTVFIFAVDLFWGWALSRVGVLYVPTDAAKTQQKKIDW